MRDGILARPPPTRSALELKDVSIPTPQEANSSGSPTQRVAKLLLVVGMHRSGTSALTGVLQKLGAELGEELMPPTRDNPKGYFENTRVVTVHERLLAALQRGWQDPRPLPAQWRDSTFGDDAHRGLIDVLGEMLKDSTLVVVKDPRTSRVLPLWADVARATGVDMGAALMVRHPDEVAGSLRKRDGLSRARAHLLWMVHLLDAERDSREIPRAFVSYEALLADWRDTLARARDSGLRDMMPEPTMSAAGEIDAFLDVSLRRHETAVVDGGASPFESLAVELFGLSLRCAAGQVQDVGAAFDDIARRLTPLAARYLEAPLQLEQELERQREEQARVDASLQLAAVRELWRPALPARPPGAARLYYRLEGDAFSEDRAVSADPVVTGVRRSAVFQLPAGTKFDYLRIDPDSTPGVYALESLAIGGEVVASLDRRLCGSNEFAMPVMRVGDAARIAAFEEDPYFILDARDAACATGAEDPLKIEVRFRSETVLSEVGGYLEDYRDALQSHGRNLAQWQEEVGAAVRNLAEQQGRIDVAVDALPEFLARQLQLGLSVDALLDRTEQLQSAIREHAGLMTTGLGAIQTQCEAQSAAHAAELSRVREQQELLLAWARRRSFGYWWRRLTGRQLVP